MKNAFILTIVTLTMIACSPKAAGDAAGKNAVDAAKGIGMELVNKTFNEWVSTTNAGDISKMLDFSYPKLFDLQPREMIEQQYSQMQMMGIKNLIKDAKLSDLSDFVTSGGQQFAKGKLTGVSSIEVPDPSMVDMLYAQIKTMFNEEDMSKTENSVDVKVNDDIYIIQDDATKKMYFLQAGAQVQPMLGQILPADVIEKLNK